MTYPEPTAVQMLIIAVAAVARLVWAFTHHGSTRMTALIVWMPLWLVVARVVYLTSSPTAPLVRRIELAAISALMDPLTIAWPVFVLVIFGLIRLFTAPRRRREANARQAATRADLVVADARRPACRPRTGNPRDRDPGPELQAEVQEEAKEQAESVQEEVRKWWRSHHLPVGRRQLRRLCHAC
jgi:hypothetical protein